MSNVIKSSFYVSIEEQKLIEVMEKRSTAKPASIPLAESDASPSALELEEKRIHQLREEMLKDAEQAAEEQLRQTAEACELMKQQAQRDIEAWWQERRAADEQMQAEHHQQGYEDGHREGAAQAEADISSKYKSIMEEARHTLEQAHAVKRQIIAEAEPFLIELSCSIAEKVIGKQISISPDDMLDLIRRTLSRRRESGVVTLCVSPSRFSMVIQRRDELLLAVGSQAELIIVPDASVEDDGCIVRSAFGSIDARIGTQLNEIKSALLQLSAGEQEQRPENGSMQMQVESWGGKNDVE